MECKKCKAYGIDSLGFSGCLVRNSMLDLPNNKVGCRRKINTIENQIKDVKKNEPKAKYYQWLN